MKIQTSFKKSFDLNESSQMYRREVQGTYLGKPRDDEDLRS